MSAEGDWTNQVQSAVIIGGPGGTVVGWFIYNGTPGPGNPPVDWGSQSSTDPFGNTLNGLIDVVSFFPAQNLYSQLTAGQVNVGKTTLNLPGTMAASISATHPGAMLLTSPKATGGNTQSQMIFEDSGESQGPCIVAVNPLRANDPAAVTNFTAESWHSLGTLTGYTITRAQYKLMENNRVALAITVLSGGANAASVSFSTTLAAAYRPPVAVVQPLTFTGASTSAPRVSLDNTGTVTLTQQANNAISILGVVDIPLDN